MDKRKVIFCDVDDVTRHYVNEQYLDDKYDIVMFDESLDQIPLEQLSCHYDAEVISIFVYSKANQDILQNFHQLKMVSTRSTGYNNVDLEYCKSRNICVANVVGYGEVAVAEFALGMLFNLTRKIGFSNRKLRNGVVDVKSDMGIDIFGKTVGVIGTGAIGRHFVKICHGIGCNVLAYDLFPNQGLIDQKLCKYMPLKDVLLQSDIISLHCPFTHDNYHMIDETAISMMKDGVFIVNTSRGELIDSIALYDGIISGKIRGAALDVLDYENAIIKHDVDSVKDGGEKLAKYSFFNEKLLQHPNVVITPHIAFNSYDAVKRILHSTINNITTCFGGGVVKSVA